MIAACMLVTTASAQSTAPKVETNTFVARGSTAALVRSTVKGAGIREEGVCYATHRTPTIDDEKTIKYFERRGKLFHLSQLTPATVYYLRAYAIGADGAVGYGNEVKIVTLPRGNTAYTYNANDATADQTRRIRAALDEAVQLYNDWQGLRGLHITCNYSAGTPTADCSYGGWMRMGANAGYQRTGTILHETNHAVGVGTTSMWNNNANLRADVSRGIWLGERANLMIRFLENDESVSVTGDKTHMWGTGGSPLAYGINGAHEDSGDPLLYIGNVLITHALHEDGLTPTNSYDNGYPYYSVDVEDSTKYYIKGVTEQTGVFTSYVAQGAGSSVVLSTTPNDSAAWYVKFNANEGKYIFRNVATGRYLTHTTSNFNDVLRANITNTPGSQQLFQLMPTRHDLTVGRPWSSYTARPLNVLFETWNGMTASGTRVSPVASDLSDGATSQHWFLLSEDEMHTFEAMVEALTVKTVSIGGEEFQQFNASRHEYYVGMPDSTTADQLTVTLSLSEDFTGTAEIEQATSFPGTAKVAIVAADGTTTATYTFHFLPSIVAGWDGQNTTGTASKPSAWGWTTTSTSAIVWGNANGMNTHYMDPGKGSTAKYENYTFDGRPYNLHRMLMFYYLAANDTYTYTFTGLQPSTTYIVSFGIAWHQTESNQAPTVVANIHSADAGINKPISIDMPATAQRLTPVTARFTTPADINADTPFTFNITCPELKTKIVLADFCVAALQQGEPQLALDVNTDGSIDTQDVLLIYRYMQSPDDNPSAYDVNTDGSVDTQDVLLIYNYIQAN